MSKNEATESQRQSEAIRGNQRPSVACHTEANRDHQMQSGRTSDKIRRNQPQSGAIRRNQTQSACPEHCVSVFLCFGRAARACVLCFCVLSRHNGPVFCVFVFWQTPLKTQGGVNCSGVICCSKPGAKPCQTTRTAAPMFANDPRRNSFEEPAPVTESPLENNCVTEDTFGVFSPEKRE
jgi:hypothetical protein